VLAVVAATLAGGYLALVSFRQEKELSVGSIRLSVSPGHKGALDVYVPLVDWGARFEAIRLPARLRVDLRTVDRGALEKVAQGAPLDVGTVRDEARDAIAAFLRALIAVVCLAGFALGVLTAFAVRHHHSPRLRWTIAASAATAVAVGVALVVLLPPRGEIAKPQYYAYGADIPRALDAAATVQRSARALEQELDAQLVGLARLVTQPANRPAIEGRPRITIASDLHNNVLALPILERAAGGGPVFFPGDLSDRGSPLENQLLARITRTGKPFVFVTGNHDSDSTALRLARDRAVVLTERGRLKPGGSYGPVVTDVAGLRVAGYGDPYQRLAADDFADRFQPEPTAAQVQAFSRWFETIEDDVDVVLVHQPALIADTLASLRESPPDRPLLFVVGHTHSADLFHEGQLTVVNGGSLGAGGTGNLADAPTRLGLARLSYDTTAGFEPLAVDLVEIDPGDGNATARRERLDQPAEEGDVGEERENSSATS
jgi:predicted phosphodiesterase